MSTPAASCPSCGAPVQFRWSGAAQIVCPFCHSILIRTDLDLKSVGKVADLPPDPSPIQLLTEGAWQGQPFQVTGRILYQYEQGGWNEWHIVFSDGRSGWLSDAQLQYAISFRADPGAALPDADAVFRSKTFTIQNTPFEVATMTIATYKGVEGELPFPYHGPAEADSGILFVDLHATGKSFATLDYSEAPAILFLGEWAEFDDLHLRNLREFEGWKQ